MDLLTKTCEYLNIVSKVSRIENMESRLAHEVLNGDLTDDQLALAEKIIGESRMKYVGELIAPVSEKKFSYYYNNPTQYFPTETPMDSTVIYNGEPHWIYIHSPADGRYGETYWISVNCEPHLYSLPVIKAFKEYEFEVGKFYKLTCVDTIHWGGNKKKYVFEIEECSEDEYMEKGFISDAYDNGFYDKCYMEQIVAEYNKCHK